MSTTSLEVSKELYEVSGWGYNHKQGDYCNFIWRQGSYKPYLTSLDENEHIPSIRKDLDKAIAPAYDLGYLLRKLPVLKDIDFRVEQDGADENGDCWVAYGVDYAAHREGDSNRWWSTDNAPEDATAKLCIELFKQGILTK